MLPTLRKQSTIIETEDIDANLIIEELLSPIIGKIENNPDYYELKVISKQSIGIEETKELINWLQLKPYSHNNKVAIISQGDKLTNEAQNLLLKTFEEPPQASYILIITNNHRRLLPTIISRGDLIRINNNNEIQDIFEIEKILNNIENKINTINELHKIKDTKERKDKIIKLLEEIHKYTLTINLNKETKLQNLKLIEKSFIAIKRNVNIKLVLENLFFNYLNNNEEIHI